MRLTKQEIKAIKKNFEMFFHDGHIYLFGSRVDDNRRGGDIDLYISPTKKDNLVYKKIEFLAHLKQEIGDQKIDVVFDYGENRLIDKIAKSKGIEL